MKIQRKKALSILLTLALALGLFAAMPPTASAATYITVSFYPSPTATWDMSGLYNADIIDSIIDADNGNLNGSYGDGSWSWESYTKTLTLTDIDFTTSADNALFLPADTTIILNGANTIKSTGSGTKSIAIGCLGGCTITGTGSLNATGGTSSGSIGIRVDYLTISGDSTVTATGNHCAIYPDYTVPSGYVYYVSTTTTPNSTPLTGNGSTTVIDEKYKYVKIVGAPRYAISLNPATDKKFPSAIVGYGAQTAYSVTVTNTGNVDTGPLSVELSDETGTLFFPISSAFTISPMNINSIPASGKERFAIRPQTGLKAGTYTATVNVGNTNVGWQSFKVSFTVKFHEIPSASISLDPATDKTFPSATEGYGAQMVHIVKVNNTGNIATGLLNVTLSGANPDSFTLSKTGIGGISIIDSIEVGKSGSFTVVPKTGLAAGTYTATVKVGNTKVEPQSFDVSFTVNPADTVTLSVSSGFGIAGQNVTVEVKLANNPGFDKFNVTLNYDPSILTYKSSEADLFSIGTFESSNIKGKGQYTASWSGDKEPLTKDGTLFRVTFAISAKAAESIADLTFADVYMANDGEKTVPVVVNGQIIVLSSGGGKG